MTHYYAHWVGEGICSFRWPLDDFRYIFSLLATHVVALNFCCLLATLQAHNLHILGGFEMLFFCFYLLDWKKVNCCSSWKFPMWDEKKRKKMFQWSSVLMKVAWKERKKWERKKKGSKFVCWLKFHNVIFLYIWVNCKCWKISEILDWMFGEFYRVELCWRWFDHYIFLTLVLFIRLLAPLSMTLLSHFPKFIQPFTLALH